MNRKFFALVALVGLGAGLAARADAAVIIYRPAPIIYRPVVFEPLPAVAYDADDRVAYDPDDRFVASSAMQGVVTFSEPFHMSVRVHDRDYSVVLHQGTVIKPTGITLAPSMVVNVRGWWGDGGQFHANRIVVLRY